MYNIKMYRGDSCIELAHEVLCCVVCVAGGMALYNNSITAYYDFLFTDLAGKWRSFVMKLKWLLNTSHTMKETRT
jgi:hypothetical protein